ncbi:MAG TPA: GNAT family N-acetyltransferase [Candidatus Koribacter sp.]
MSEFVVRAANEGDAEAIADCLASAFRPVEKLYTDGAFRDTVLSAEGICLRMQTMQLFVACDSAANVVGTIGCEVLDGAQGHLRGMAVRPEWQGCGVADELLMRAEEELRSKGCRRCVLDTTEPLARAMRFYERHGYARSGKVTDFFGMPLVEYGKAL